MQVSVQKHQSACKSQRRPWRYTKRGKMTHLHATCVYGQNTIRLTWGREGVGVALMEAAGKMLQHSLPLLGLSNQHHHFQERSAAQISNKRSWYCFMSSLSEKCRRSTPRSGNSHLRAWSSVSPVKSKNFRYSSPTARLKSLLNRKRTHSDSQQQSKEQQWQLSNRGNEHSWSGILQRTINNN